MAKEKVFVLERTGKYTWSKTFRKEGALLNAIRLNDNYQTNYVVRVFEETSSCAAQDYKKGYITQKEREEQLDMMMDDESSMKYLFAIKNKLKEICEAIAKEPKDPKVRHHYNSKDRIPKSILNQFKIGGLCKSTFNNIIGNYESKKYLLLEVSQEQEWYEMLLRAHSFRELKVGGYYGKKLVFPQQSIDNFKNAKKAIRLEKISASRAKKKASLTS